MSILNSPKRNKVYEKKKWGEVKFRTQTKRNCSNLLFKLSREEIKRKNSSERRKNEYELVSFTSKIAYHLATCDESIFVGKNSKYQEKLKTKGHLLKNRAL